jgi:hypothetical protein
MQWRPAAQSTSVVHQVGQVTAVPLQTYGEQLGSPAKPTVAGTQVPGEATELHTSHAWLQGELQHTPSMHRLDLQSVPSLQVAPRGLRETHWPPVQVYPGAHWAAEVHELGQAAEVPVHTKGSHVELPAEPAAMSLQVPSNPGMAQVSHEPPQAVSQQYESTQCPWVHWRSRAQIDPFGKVARHCPDRSQ